MSSETSRKLRVCMDGKPPNSIDGRPKSKAHFVECVDTVVGRAGGSVATVLFEQNGKYARVLVYWQTPEQKANIIFDTEATEVEDIDLLTAAEVDALVDDRWEE